MGFSFSLYTITATIKNSFFPNHTQTLTQTQTYDAEFRPDPSLVLLPPYLTTTSVDKDRLPVVEYTDFKSCNREKEDEEEEDPKCAVCLSRIEACSNVRELGNCEHAFHADCLDSWIDGGSGTCPVCRAPLVSGNGGKDERKKHGEDPWRSERMVYLFGEDCLMEEL